MMGVMWVLAVLTASENSQLLTMLLSGTVVFHAFFCLIGYCIINKRVRENLNRSFLRCIGRKVPLLDSSQAVSVSSQNATSNPRSPGGYLGGGSFEASRKNMGISASSTTSKSTTKTSSSPYRSDGGGGAGQMRHTSTSTSNYNSDTASYMRGYSGGNKRRQRDDRHGRRTRKDSDSGSETDGRSLELASSHSSDDDESRIDRNCTAVTHHSAGVTATPSYLPNITEHVTATTPPELNVIQSPQLFPSVRSVHTSKWTSQAPDVYLTQNTNGNFSDFLFSSFSLNSNIAFLFSFQLVDGPKKPVRITKSIRTPQIHQHHCHHCYTLATISPTMHPI